MRADVAARQPRGEQRARAHRRPGGRDDLVERGGECGPALDRVLREQSAARERVLGQDALAERVDCRDRRDVEAARRGLQALARGRVDRPDVRAGCLVARRIGPQDAADEAADSPDQLCGRALAERHDQDLVDARVAAHQPVDDQVFDQIRLAGAGRRLDHRGPIARQLGELAGTDRRRRGHFASPIASKYGPEAARDAGVRVAVGHGVAARVADGAPVELTRVKPSSRRT